MLLLKGLLAMVFIWTDMQVATTAIEETWHVTINLTTTKHTYEHKLVFAHEVLSTKLQAADLCKPPHPNCTSMDIVDMSSSGSSCYGSEENPTDPSSFLQLIPDSRIYTAQLHIASRPSSGGMIVSCTKPTDSPPEQAWTAQLVWKVELDTTVPLCFIRTQQTMQSEMFEETLDLTLPRNCAGSCHATDECCQEKAYGILYTCRGKLHSPKQGGSTSINNLVFNTVTAMLSVFVAFLIAMALVCTITAIVLARKHHQMYPSAKRGKSEIATNCRKERDGTSNHETGDTNEVRVYIRE